MKNLTGFVFTLLCLLTLACACVAEPAPRWIKKGVKSLDKERSNKTYRFHVAHSWETDARMFDEARLKPLLDHVDSTYRVSRSKMVLDSVVVAGQPTVYTVSFDRNGRHEMVYAQIVDEHTTFEDYADNTFEYNRYQLYAISEPGAVPQFDRFLVTRKYNGMAVVMSIIPGLGQIYKGQPAKGYSILASEAVLVGGVIFSTVGLRRNLRLADENPQFYDSYQSNVATYRHLRLFCGIAGAGLYVYNILDAAFAKGARYVEIKRNDSPNAELTLAPVMYQGTAGIGASLRF